MKQFVCDASLEIHLDHVANAAFNRYFDIRRVEERPHRQIARHRNELRVVTIEGQVLAHPILVRHRQRRRDQGLHIPCVALAGQLSQRVERAVIALQLADEHLAIFRDAQVVDAVAVERQRRAEELRRAEGIFHDAELAPHRHLLRAGAATHGDGRARRRVDEVGRFEHRLPVRVVEVVVVVGDDGVFDAFVLNQHGALRALDVEAVDQDRAAGLRQVDRLHLRALEFARVVARDHKRRQAAVIVGHVGDEVAVGIRSRGNGLRRLAGEAVAGQLRRDRRSDLAGSEVERTQIEDQDVAALLRAQHYAIGALGYGDHQRPAVGADRHAGHAQGRGLDTGALERNHLVVVGAAGVDVHDQQAVAACALAVTLAFADEQHAAHGGQTGDVLAGRHVDGLNQLGRQGIDDEDGALAAYEHAAQVTGEGDGLDLVAREVGAGKIVPVALEFEQVDLAHDLVLAQRWILANELNAGAGEHGSHIRYGIDARGIAGELDRGGPGGDAGAGQHIGGNQAHQLPTDAADGNAGRGRDFDFTGSAAGQGLDIPVAAVGKQGAHDDAAAEFSGGVVGNGELDRAGSAIDRSVGDVGQRDVAPGRGRGRQHIARIQAEGFLGLRQVDIGELRDAKVVAGRACCSCLRGDDADHLGGDVQAHEAAANGDGGAGEAVKGYRVARADDEIERIRDHARQAFGDGVIAGHIETVIGRAGGAGHHLAVGVGADVTVVDEPPAVFVAAVGLEHGAPAEEQDFFSGLGIDAGLNGNRKLQRVLGSRLAHVEPEGADGLEGILRRGGQAECGLEVVQGDTADGDRCVGSQRPGADQHGFARGADYGATNVGHDGDAGGRSGGRIVVGKLRLLHGERDVALADDAGLTQGIDREVGFVAFRIGAVEVISEYGGHHMDHADGDSAALVGADQAAGIHAGNTLVAAVVARAAGDDGRQVELALFIERGEIARLAWGADVGLFPGIRVE